jgi:hypothetical protein
MKALMNIFNMDAPVLNKYEEWSKEFREFVTDCLNKDQTKRIDCSNILSKHRKFFAKSKSIEYIKDHLLEDIKPLIDRTPPKILSLSQSFFDKQY